MELMDVLIGFECSGEIRQAFRNKGHNAWSNDLKPAEDKSRYHLRMDVREALKINKWNLFIGHPECTHVAASGSRWFDHPSRPDKPMLQAQAISFFIELFNSYVEKICLENPIGVLSSKFRKPDQIIQPWRFGHSETKATCLWLKNLPLLIEKPYVDFEPIQDMARVNNLFLTVSDKVELARLRAKTYRGIALAMADQWG